MKQDIILSVIIVNFNTYSFLSKCLESIKRSNVILEKIEIIVVDNNSGNKEAERIKETFSYVNLIKNRENIGFAKANNQAIKKSLGKYVLLLNPDTIVKKGTFETMLKFMEKNVKVGVATCRVNLVSGQIDDACNRGFPSPWNAFCHFSGLAKLFPQSKFFNGYHLGFWNMEQVHEIDSCVGAFLLVRREVGERVGWLDEDYFWYGEDIDFCYKVKNAGWKVMYVPTTSILHYKGVSGGIKKHSQHLSLADKKIKYLATRSRFEVMRIFYEKHYKKKYPEWIRAIVLWGIKLKEYLSLAALG
ncbi:glycosyltransferase family 2 protein [Patescibacteria group bacterium]|nr:glycosyltransferase family 2 protein [Patescibacteria group bacterium]